MALIIKGGEIPVDCLRCDEMFMLSQCPIHMNEPLKYCNGTRHPECPIIGEIPDKHGDLIDRDELKIDDSWALVGTGTIWDAPVIVEANK